MKKILTILIFLSAILWFSSAFALQIQSAPTLSSSTQTSIAIDWEDVDGALWYYVYYSEQTGIPDWYDFEWIDLIESSETTIENLSRETDYFVAVTVVDENGNESQFSPEAMFTTSLQWTTDSTPKLAIESVWVLSSNEIEVQFNTMLDQSTDAVREIKLTEKESWVEVFVSDISLNQINPTTINVKTDTDFTQEAEYNLTVVSIQDVNKNNIESGVDWVTTFRVPRWSATSFQELQDTPVQVVDLEDEVVLNAAGIDDETSKWWALLSDDDLIKTAEVAAKDNQALPQTWPETIFLLVLAVLLWAWLFILYTKKA